MNDKLNNSDDILPIVASVEQYYTKQDWWLERLFYQGKPTDGQQIDELMY
jgi:hypothetical protein